MSEINQHVLNAFYEELEKISSVKYLGAAAVGGGMMYGVGKGKKMYGLAKKEQGEQDDAQMLRRMQALQAKMQLKKQYGQAFSEG